MDAAVDKDVSGMLDTLIIPQQQRHMLEEACLRYEKNINEAGPYLVARGFTQEAALSFRLGVVRDPIPGHDRFEGMLSIPYLSKGGVLGFKFRCLGDHDCKALSHPKYDSPSGQRARLFNVRALESNTDTVAIVEGEMAAAIFQTQVGVPTVGTPGTQWVKEHPHWARCFADFERVLVVADHDVKDGRTDPGKGVGHAKAVVSTLPASELILPPPGHDPDSWVLEYGADEVKRACGL